MRRGDVGNWPKADTAAPVKWQRQQELEDKFGNLGARSGGDDRDIAGDGPRPRHGADQ